MVYISIYLHILFIITRLFVNSKIIHRLIDMSISLASGSSLLIQIQIAIVGIIIVLGIFFIWRTVSRMEQRLRIVEVNQKTLAQCQSNPSLNINGVNPSTPLSPLSCGIMSGVCLRNEPNIQTFSTSATDFSEIDEFSDEMLKVFGNTNQEMDIEDYEDEEEEDKHVKDKITSINTQKVNENSDTNVVNISHIVITPVASTSTVASTPNKVAVEKVNTSISTNSTNVPHISLVDEVLSEADTESGNPLSKSKLKAMGLEKLKAICVHHNISSEGSKNVLISRILGETRD